MYGNQRERIPDLLESPNSRRDLRNSRISNDHLRRYEAAMTKYEKLSPHPRRRLTNNLRLEQQYRNFQGHSSSDECLTRNKSKSTSSIDTQSVNNILDEFEDLDYRKSSDLSDIDVGSVEVTNFEAIMDFQKRQVTEKQNSRAFRSSNQVSTRDHHYPASPTKVSRQTQVQQRPRDRQRDSEKRFFSPPEENSRHERKNSASFFQNQEVRASIRSAKTPPEILLRKGEVQKRVDEWLSQTRNQHCAGFTKESKGLTRSNSSAEQKTHRRLRQQELRSRRSQLNGSSSYDDLTHEGLKKERNKSTDHTKVSVGVNTSRGTYKQYLALKNKARIQKQLQENANQDNAKASIILRSREASPATPRAHHHARGEAMNLSFRSSPSKRQEHAEQEQYQQQQQQQQQRYAWTCETGQSINVRSKSARARHQMENRISSLVKARNEMSTGPEVCTTTATAAAAVPVNKRASFKRESARSSFKPISAIASPSKEPEESVASAVTQTSQDQVAGVSVSTRSSEQDSGSKAADLNPPTESSSDLSQEIYGSVSARVRAFQDRNEYRVPKSRSMQSSNILIETRNKSPMSPTRNDGFYYKESECNQSTFKPNAAPTNQSSDQSFTRKDREIDSTTRYVEKIYETSLQPQVIHADNLESVFRPGCTNFVYGEGASKENSSIFKREDSDKRKTANANNNESDRKNSESGLNHCLKLLQRSPSFRLKRSHPAQKERESPTKSPNNETTLMTEQSKPMNSFGSFQNANTFTPTSQKDVKEIPKETGANEVILEKLDPNSYEARSTLKLNSSKTANDIIENDKNKREDSSLKKSTRIVRPGITNLVDQSKNEGTSSSATSIGASEQTYKSSKEKIEDGAVVNEVLVKNLQFKQDLPSSTPPAPPPRTCLEPTRKPESPLIVELSPLRHKLPLNYNSVLNGDYSNLHTRTYQQQQQENGKIYVTKEEMERKKLIDLLKNKEFELAKMDKD